MATTRAYTTIEQSRKLAEILPLESADMYWDYDVQKHEDYPMVMDEQFDDTCVRAWSLAALLNIIPKHIKEYNTLRIDIGEKDFSIWYDEIGYGVNTELPDITMENPVDACVETIIKLHGLNLL